MKHFKRFTGYFAESLIRPGEEFNWWRFVKQPRALIKVFSRALWLVVGRSTPTWAKAIYTVAHRLRKISRSQGAEGLVKYLKVLYIVTQQAAGGYRVSDLTPHGPRVSRTTGGLPRFILKAHRADIRAGKTWVIRMYLTMFGLYRVITMPGKVKINTITALSTFTQSNFEKCVGFVPTFWTKLSAHIASSEEIPKGPWSQQLVHKVLKFRPAGSFKPTLFPQKLELILKSGPLSGRPFVGNNIPLWVDHADRPVISPYVRMSPEGVKRSVSGWVPKGLVAPGLHLWEVFNKELDKKELTTSNSGTLFWTLACWNISPLKSYLNRWIEINKISWMADLFEHVKTKEGCRVSWGKPGPQDQGNLGKLAFLDEPAGKVRVVAMVDVLTQTIFKPLHDWLFSVLRRIPEDGTFDQMAPVRALLSRGIKVVHSYDLSAATDRLPLSLQEAILEWVLGEESANLWACLLVNRDYCIRPRTAEKRGLDNTRFRYACGQPMGAYSSWAMLALTHHFCVQLVASRVRGIDGSWFSDYAVLGDDIIIADEAVAHAYFKFMTEELHVEINLAKCLISSTGSFEFAKRTYVHSADATPISLKGLIAGLRSLPVMEGVLSKLDIPWSSKISRIMRACGYGYKSCGRILSALKTQSRLRGLLIFLSRPGGLCGLPFSEWISQTTWNVKGAPLSEKAALSLAQSLTDMMLVESEKTLQRLAVEVRGAMRSVYVHNSVTPTSQLHEIFMENYHGKLLDTVNELNRDLHVTKLGLQRLSTEVTSAQLDEFFTKVDNLMAEVSLLPSNGALAIRAKDKVPSGTMSISLWKKFHRIVMNDIRNRSKDTEPA